MLALGADRLREWAASEPSAGGVRALPRRSRPPSSPHPLRRGRGGARARLRRLRRPVRRLQRAHRQRRRLRAGRVGGRDAGRRDPGLDRHAARERRPDVAAERLGELRGRLPRRAQRAGGEPRRHGQAGGVPGARPPLRVAARGVALAVERSRRGLRQPDRDVRGESADLAPLLAVAAEDPRRRPARAVRPRGAARGVVAGARVRAVRRVDLRVARAARRERTSTPSGAAASRSAGSTCIRRRGRWAARSPPGRRERRRSS